MPVGLMPPELPEGPAAALGASAPPDGAPLGPRGAEPLAGPAAVEKHAENGCLIVSAGLLRAVSGACVCYRRYKGDVL